MSKKLARSSGIAVIRAAEMKISLALSYFSLVGTMALVSVTLYEVRNGEVRRRISEYILCSSGGNCSLSIPTQLGLGVASDFVTIMLACLPLVTFLLSVNVQTCKKVLRPLGRLASKCKTRQKPESNVTIELGTILMD